MFFHATNMSPYLIESPSERAHCLLASLEAYKPTHLVIVPRYYRLMIATNELFNSLKRFETLATANKPSYRRRILLQTFH